jgi:hypothetical protein
MRGFIVGVLVAVVAVIPARGWCFGASSAWVLGYEGTAVTESVIGGMETITIPISVAPLAADGYGAAAGGLAVWETGVMTGASIATLGLATLGSAAVLCYNNQACHDGMANWLTGHNWSYDPSTGKVLGPSSGMIAKNDGTRGYLSGTATAVGDMSDTVSGNTYTCVGIFDNGTDARAAATSAAAAADPYGRANFAGSGTLGTAWLHGWGAGWLDCMAYPVANGHDYKVAVYPPAASWYTGVYSGSSVASSDMSNATSADAAAQNHALAVMVAAFMAAAADAYWAASQGQYGDSVNPDRMDKATRDSMGKTMANSVPDSGYQDATNKQTDNSNPKPASGSDLPNPYPVDVQSLPDATLQADIENGTKAGLKDFASDVTAPTVPDAEKDPTTVGSDTYDQQFKRVNAPGGILDSFYDGIMSLPMFTLLKGVNVELSGQSSVVCLGAYWGGDNACVDLSYWQSTFQTIGTVLYSAACVMGILLIFM